MILGLWLPTVPQIPVAREHEARPVERVPPALLAHELELRGSQRGGRLEPFLPHRLIEPRHQLRRGFVVDLPEAREHQPRAGVHEATDEADQAFASDPLSHGAAAAAQHHEIHWQLHVVDVVQPHEPLAGRASLVEEGQNDPRQLGTLVVDDRMRGEMNDAVVPDGGVEGARDVRLESEAQVRTARERGDAAGFLSRPDQARQDLRPRALDAAQRARPRRGRRARGSCLSRGRLDAGVVRLEDGIGEDEDLLRPRLSGRLTVTDQRERGRGGEVDHLVLLHERHHRYVLLRAPRVR